MKKSEDKYLLEYLPKSGPRGLYGSKWSDLFRFKFLVSDLCMVFEEFLVRMSAVHKEPVQS